MILRVNGADFGSTGKPRASGDDPLIQIGMMEVRG